MKLSHGYNRTRIGVFLEDSETAKAFNIKSVKNQGIDYENNYNLGGFVDDDGKTVVVCADKKPSFIVHIKSPHRLD